MNPVSNEIFQTFWMGGDICPITIFCLNSFVVRDCVVKLYAYEAIPSAPRGVEVCDAEAIMPRTEAFETHGGFEHFSDLFRYALLERHGGWWIDTDVTCNTDWVPPAEVAFARERHLGQIANGQMKFPAGHPVMRDAAKRAVQLKQESWGATGPHLLTGLIEAAGIENLQWPQEDFYPICWVESAKFLFPEYLDEMQRRTRQAKFIHIYTSRFRRRLGFDQRKFLPPRGSFLEELYFRYGIGEAASGLSLVDENALRAHVTGFMKEDWIKEILREEGLEFNI